jgi:hypothetical protein
MISIKRRFCNSIFRIIFFDFSFSLEITQTPSNVMKYICSEYHRIAENINDTNNTSLDECYPDVFSTASPLPPLPSRQMRFTFSPPDRSIKSTKITISFSTSSISISSSPVYFPNSFLLNVHRWLTKILKIYLKLST